MLAPAYYILAGTKHGEVRATVLYIIMPWVLSLYYIYHNAMGIVTVLYIIMPWVLSLYYILYCHCTIYHNAMGTVTVLYTTMPWVLSLYYIL